MSKTFDADDAQFENDNETFETPGRQPAPEPQEPETQKPLTPGLDDGSENDGAEPNYISPNDVAEMVLAFHEAMDEIKDWSITTVDWLEHEADRLERDGDKEHYDMTCDLMAFVHTLYRRLMEGEERAAIPPIVLDEMAEEAEEMEE